MPLESQLSQITGNLPKRIIRRVTGALGGPNILGQTNMIVRLITRLDHTIIKQNRITFVPSLRVVFLQRLVVEDLAEIFEGDGFLFVGCGRQAERAAVPDCDDLRALGGRCCSRDHCVDIGCCGT